MHAKVGDWLVVAGHTDTSHERRAEILEVSDNGQPPFRVRWTDNGHTVLVFPGPDATVAPADHGVAAD